MTSDFLHGTVHEAGEDLQAAVRADPAVLGFWEGLTPLGRNEFICWVEDAKQAPSPRRANLRGIASIIVVGTGACERLLCINEGTAKDAKRRARLE